MSIDNNSQSINDNSYSTIEIDGIEIFDSIDQAPVTGTPNRCPAPVSPVPTGAEGVPAEDAAKIFGLSINALKKRLRKGSLTGYKVSSKYGEKWFVDRKELAAYSAPDTGTPNRCPAPVPIGAEGVPQEIDKHLEVICELQDKIEALTYRNGYLESQLESYREQIKLLTDSQHKLGWWPRLKNWLKSDR